MEFKDLFGTCFLELFFSESIFENNYLKTHRTLFWFFLKSVLII